MNTSVDLRGRNFLKELDFTQVELTYLLDLSAQLKAEKSEGRESKRLTGRNVALVFEKASTRTRAAFEVAAYDQGAAATYLGPQESQLGTKESLKDTARVLGRMYDGIEYRGFGQQDVETLGAYAGVPVWNGLSDQWHPTQMLADLLTMREYSAGRPLTDLTFCYLGDTRNNVARSLLITGCLFGMDVRLAGPRTLWPDDFLVEIAGKHAADSGAHMLVTDSVKEAVAGADFIYTDVWVSMGEAATSWDSRIRMLLPYQVTSSVMAATGKDSTRFMHCLPALHNAATSVGRGLEQRTGLTALEVTDEVFESDRSVVFEQAANRLPTIKAVMVATLEARS